MPGPRTILVVDDEPPIADLLAVILRKSGYMPHVAYSAEQALTLLDTIIPEVLISDVMMPNMNGPQLAFAVKKRYPECDVLLISGAAKFEDILEEARKGGYEFKFLHKPVHPADLLQKIN